VTVHTTRPGARRGPYRPALACLAVFVGLTAGTGRTEAGLLTIINPSFETPALDDGQFTVGFAVVPGWNTNGSTLGASGIINPTTSQIPSSSIVGNQTAYSNGGSNIFQTLSDVLTPGTYVLSVRLIDQLGGGTGHSPVIVRLNAGATLLALSDASSPDFTTDGGFVYWTRTYVVGPSHPALGQALSIELLSGPGTMNFDDVTLDSSSAITAPPTGAVP
jgi:hypothetical protein